MKIIAVCNQKGGVGKTTTSLNLGVAIARQGYHVLLVDFDPQGNLTDSTSVDLTDDDQTIFEVLKNEVRPKQIVKRIYCDSMGYCDLLPADLALASAEVTFTATPGREKLLEETLADITDDYDFCFIDCPPSLGILSTMALSTANEVLIPVQAHMLPLKGVKQLQETISVIQRRVNPKLKINGVLVTQAKKRTLLTDDVTSALKQFFPNMVYDTQITLRTAVAEAPGFRENLFEYKKSADSAGEYTNVAVEFLNKEKEKENIHG